MLLNTIFFPELNFQMAKFLFEYETPRVVTVHHIPLGILRLVLQSCVFAFVLLYQLWYSKGYQSFDIVASSVTTKVDISRSNEQNKSINKTNLNIKFPGYCSLKNYLILTFILTGEGALSLGAY